MCFMSTPKAPPPVEIPTPAEAPSSVPDQGTAAAQTAAQDTRRKRLAAGQSSTLVTGGAGLTQPATTANKTLYGA